MLLALLFVESIQSIHDEQYRDKRKELVAFDKLNLTFLFDVGISFIRCRSQSTQRFQTFDKIFRVDFLFFILFVRIV